jgi:electron transfer flavoprotein beta subunit
VKILVCVKQVPATDSRIKPAADGQSIDPAGVEYVINPYDEYAVEEALRLKENSAARSSPGHRGGQEGLRTAALGCDRAHRQNRRSPAPTLATARGRHHQGTGARPRAMGKQAWMTTRWPCHPCWPNCSTAQAGVVISSKSPRMASLVAGARSRRHRGHRCPSGRLSTQKGLNEPRYASFKGIMAAKKKPIDTVDPASVGLSAATAGKAAARAKLDALTPPPERAAGRLLSGDADAQVKELARILHEELKVI